MLEKKVLYIGVLVLLVACGIVSCEQPLAVETITTTTTIPAPIGKFAYNEPGLSSRNLYTWYAVILRSTTIDNYGAAHTVFDPDDTDLEYPQDWYYEVPQSGVYSVAVFAEFSVNGLWTLGSSIEIAAQKDDDTDNRIPVAQNWSPANAGYSRAVGGTTLIPLDAGNKLRLLFSSTTNDYSLSAFRLNLFLVR